MGLFKINLMFTLQFLKKDRRISRGDEMRQSISGEKDTFSKLKLRNQIWPSWIIITTLDRKYKIINVLRVIINAR